MMNERPQLSPVEQTTGTVRFGFKQINKEYVEATKLIYAEALENGPVMEDSL